MSISAKNYNSNKQTCEKKNNKKPRKIDHKKIMTKRELL